MLPRLFILALMLLAGRAGATPRRLSLDDALALARTRGYDLLLADAARASADGDLVAARAIPNPYVLVGWMHMWNYLPHDDPVLGPCIQCANDGPTFTFADMGAIENALSGKLGLRRRVAEWALRAARMGRADAQRNLELLVKQQYVQVLVAERTLAFVHEVQAFSTQMLGLYRQRYPSVINEGQLARVESDALAADANVTNAVAALGQAKAGLLYLLGFGSADETLVLDERALVFRVPPRLAAPRFDDLLALAIAARPDLKQADFARRGARESLRLAERRIIPDISIGLNWLSAGYAQNTAAPPQLTLQLSFILPLFYQQQGEVRKAEAGIRQGDVQYDKTLATLASDVRNALAAFVANRDLVRLMEQRQLAAARKARDITKLQYEAGAAMLTDYLDAQRTFVAVNQTYLQELAAYWSAVFQLEQAVAADLRQESP